MQRFIACFALVALAGCATQGGGPRGERFGVRSVASPSELVAAELAFARLAQEEGQWTAFRKTAADDAVMFVPERVNARNWLNGRTDPPAAVQWEPAKVFLSCDGQTGATTGPWTRPDGTVGYFTTVWRKDDDGDWHWLLDHGDALGMPRETPDFVATRVADCRGDQKSFQSRREERRSRKPDDTLTWSADIRTDGSRTVTVSLWNGESYETVIRDTVAAQP